MNETDMIRNYCIYVLFPIWLIVGFLDFLQHRKTNISETSGLTESISHQLLLLSMGPAILCGLFLEINKMALLLMIVCLVIHQILVYVDIWFARNYHRDIQPIERIYHIYIVMISVALLSAILVLKWSELTLDSTWDLQFHWKAEPLPTGGIILAFALMAGLGIIPYSIELYSCYAKFKFEENYNSETTFHLTLDDNCIGVPIVLISLSICIHWKSFFGIFYLNNLTPDFSLRLKEVPIDPAVSVLILVLGLFTVAMPYVIQFVLLKRDMTRENIRDSRIKS